MRRDGSKESADSPVSSGKAQKEDRLDVRRKVKGKIGAFGRKAGESSESQSE